MLVKVALKENKNFNVTLVLRTIWYSIDLRKVEIKLLLCRKFVFDRIEDPVIKINLLTYLFIEIYNKKNLLRSKQR